MKIHDRMSGIGYVLAAILTGIPAAAWGTSGEVLLQELRQQVDVQRHTMSHEDLDFAGDQMGRDLTDVNSGQLVECNPTVIADYHSNRSKPTTTKHENYLYNATYTQVRLAIGNDFCTYLTRPVNRQLTVDEARDVIMAERMEFPRYDPPAHDRQIGEEKFQLLRSQAQAKRKSMESTKRDVIMNMANHLVECSDKQLADDGVWRESPPPREYNEDIEFINYVWGYNSTKVGWPCVYVRSPLHRGLTVDEARDLLTFTGTEVPAEDNWAPPSFDGTASADQHEHSESSSDSIKKKLKLLLRQ